MDKIVTENNSDTDEQYEILMDAIVTQQLAPSQKVSENILSDMFGISRSSSRNLMERLTAQQFLVNISPRITQVAPLTLLEIKQNFALRKILIPEIFILSANHLDYDQLFKLHEEIATTRQISDDRQALALLKANKSFNLAICEKVTYPQMVHWARQLEDMAMRIYWLYLKTQKSFPFAFDKQKRILECLKSGQSQKIKNMIHTMLSETEELILNSIFSNEQFYTQDLTV